MHEAEDRNILLDVGEILRSFQQEGGLATLHAGREEMRVVRALSICRTAALGGHVDACLES